MLIEQKSLSHTQNAADVISGELLIVLPVKKGKSAIRPLCNSPVVLYSVSDKAAF